MNHSSTIELSESALRRNLRFLRALVGERTRFVSVVKGNAYGHGIRAFVPLAERCGVRDFAVANSSEAQAVVESRTTESRLMIMGYVGDDTLSWAIANDIAFFVFDLDRLTAATAAAGQLGRAARIHLELETGLHRTGLDEDALDAALDLIRRAPEKIVLEGVCTHFAGAECLANSFRIQAQRARFDDLCARVRTTGLDCGLRHAACSAAAINYPETMLDMVRIGIAQYGFWPNVETRMQYLVRHAGDVEGARRSNPLRRVMRWSSHVMSVKEVGPGEFVGYGTSYVTTRRQRLAVVPVGYTHGFARSMSNTGHVLVRGRRAPVVGTVNMNATTVDVTDIPGVQRGDEVVLIGSQRHAQISVASFSDLVNHLNYEVLVRLPAEIPRVVVK